MNTHNRQRRLGRGLSALMADVAVENEPTDRRELRRIPIDRIEPNPDQPRRAFDEDGLADLAASIREKGVLQPLVVRPHPTSVEHFEIVAGERRWRAAQLAQQHDLPAIVRDFDDGEVIEVAIIENVQRTNLNAVEEAAGYRQLIDRFGHTQERVAEALGKSRSHIANLLRLLNLPAEVQAMIADGRLSAGHARAVITSPEPLALAQQIVDRGLSVRETERLVKKTPAIQHPLRPSMGKDADTLALESDLAAATGLRVVIDHRSDGAGSLTFRYRTLEELDDLCRRVAAVT
jgi:ParB family transcriptional regulator, chromosome partitioning protein